MPMAVVRRARARQRRLAVGLCLLWLLGAQVLPDLHLATHAWLTPHQHEGDAPRRGLTVTYANGARTTPPAHRHGAVEHRHTLRVAPAAVAATPATQRTQPIIDEAPDRSAAVPDPGHGARSLAHRTLAIAAPAPVITAPAPTSWHLWYERADLADGASWRAAIAAAARGPPAARAS
jgi:hypothetical protein